MLSIIAGKPGSGKSYHMASIVVDMLDNWLRYEHKECKPYPSSIWTNMKFNLEGLNETLSKRLGREVDVSHYMNYCDQSFFDAKRFWWEQFPATAVIIIDEVHFHLAKDMAYGYGGLSVEKGLVNWISTHRHSGQELYFLSQHTDQFARAVLGIADQLLDIINAKSIYFGFPYNIHLSDIYELKSAFGINTQYYRVKMGMFRGKTIRWSGGVENILMKESVFRVYQTFSHGKEGSSAVVTGDRPSLNRTPLEAIWWFTRKHGYHLIPKGIFVILFPFMIFFAFTKLPLIAIEAVMAGQPSVKKASLRTTDSSRPINYNKRR